MFNKLKDIIIRYQQQDDFNKQLIINQIKFYISTRIISKKDGEELLALLN